MNLTPEILDEEGKSILFARVASKLLNDGKVDQATLISEVGIKKHPNYAQGHYILGKCYQEKDMYEEARAEYERVLRYDSSHLCSLKELAGLYQSTGLVDVYKDYLYRLLTLDPLNDRVLDECKEQGVYDLWKSKSENTVTFQNDFGSEKDDVLDISLDEEKKLVEEEAETEKKETEDLLKIDLTKFENQVDDFTTIMDGLIQETNDEGNDADTTNYLKDLESPVEIESELLAEEKPIEESIDELDAFEKEELMEESKSPFLELDFSENIKQDDSQENEQNEDSVNLNEDTESISIEEELNKEPQEVENSFDLPELKLDEESKEEAKDKDAHEKTELVFEDNNKNVEIEFEEEEVKEEIPDKEMSEETIELDNKNEEVIKENIPVKKEAEEVLELDKEYEEEENQESPYVKQKIVSQTLGEILVSQNKYKEAKEVFLALKKQQPENTNIDKKLEILDKIIALEENKEN